MFFNFNNKTTLDQLVIFLNKELGISINSNTYDYEILSALKNYAQDTNNLISETINKNLYENLKGDELKRFLNFFGIAKLGGSAIDLYQFTFDIDTINTFQLPRKSKIIFKNELYELAEDYYFTPNEQILITCTKLYNSYSFQNSVFSKEAVVQFDTSSMIFASDNEKQETLSDFSSNVVMLTYNHLPKTEESDFEYSERAKSILQQLGYSNNKKIEMELYSDVRIKNIIMQNANGLVKVIIIPKILEDADIVIAAAQETINYYKNENIEVVKPNIIGLTITGITEQIGTGETSSNVISLIYSSIENYISYATTNNKILKSEIINIINDILNSEMPGTLINPSGIILGYKYYLHTNYEEYLSEIVISETLKIYNTDAVIVSNIK